MLFYDNRKKIYAFPPVDELFDRLSVKIFLGHLKKNIVQRNVAEKKILASNWGMKKNSCTEKLPNPPPQISNGPSLSIQCKQCGHVNDVETSHKPVLHIGLLVFFIYTTTIDTALLVFFSMKNTN